MVSVGIFRENLARKRDAGRFAAAGQQLLAQLHQVFGPRRREPAPVARQIEQRAARAP